MSNLAANPYSNANCFLICRNRATKEFEHSIAGITGATPGDFSLDSVIFCKVMCFKNILS